MHKSAMTLSIFIQMFREVSFNWWVDVASNVGAENFLKDLRQNVQLSAIRFEPAALLEQFGSGHNMLSGADISALLGDHIPHDDVEGAVSRSLQMYDLDNDGSLSSSELDAMVDFDGKLSAKHFIPAVADDTFSVKTLISAMWSLFMMGMVVAFVYGSITGMADVESRTQFKEEKDRRIAEGTPPLAEENDNDRREAAQVTAEKKKQ